MPIVRKEIMPYEYDIKLTGSDGVVRSLTTNCHMLGKIANKMRMSYSVILNICGQQRAGKSVVGLWLSYLIMNFLGKQYNPVENTFYEPNTAIQNLEGKDRLVLMVDEAGDILNRREWYKQTHQALGSIVNTQGYKTILYIFISPFILDIDSQFTKHFDFQVRVDSRGRFKTFQFMKKYDETNPQKLIRRKFLDSMSLKLEDIPGSIVKEYMEFSINEKERIRRKSLLKSKKNVSHKLLRMSDQLRSISGEHYA